MRRFGLGVGGLGNLVLDRLVWGWCDCGDFGYGWLLCCFVFSGRLRLLRVRGVGFLWCIGFGFIWWGLGFVLVLIIVCGFVLIVRLLGCGY